MIRKHLPILTLLSLTITFLGERPQPFHVAGYALVLAGVAIAARKDTRHTSA